MTTGIYTITHIKSGKLYVGSGVSIENRWSVHLCDLRRSTHYNRYLQNAWNKYGESEFSFSIIEICDKLSLIIREQFWIDNLKTGIPLYNLAPKAGSCLGIKHTEEAKAKLRAAQLRLSENPEHRKMLSQRALKQHAEGRIGRRFWSEEAEIQHKLKMKGKGLGKVHSESVRQKMKEAWTPERKLKQAEQVKQNMVGVIPRSGHKWTEKQRQAVASTWTPEKKARFSEISRERERQKKERCET